MDFEVPEKIKVITSMMDEFVEKELIPLEPEFLRKTFKEMLLKNKEVRSRITKAELDQVMDPANYVGVAPQIVDSVVAKALALTSRKKVAKKAK